MLDGGFLWDSFFEPLVGLLQEGKVIVERLHVQRCIDVQISTAIDDITQRCAVFKFCSASPRVIGII